MIQKGRGEIAHIVMNECECGSQGSKLPFLDEARFNMGWTQGTDAEYLSGLKVHTESSSVNFELPPMSKMEYTGEQLWKCSANINDDFFILKHVAMPPPLPRQANLCVAEIQAEKDSKEKAKEWCITSDIVDDEKY